MLERKRRTLTFLKEKGDMHHVCFLTILWYSQNDNDP